MDLFNLKQKNNNNTNMIKTLWIKCVALLHVQGCQNIYLCGNVCNVCVMLELAVCM